MLGFHPTDIICSSLVALSGFHMCRIYAKLSITAKFVIICSCSNYSALYYETLKMPLQTWFLQDLSLLAKEIRNHAWELGFTIWVTMFGLLLITKHLLLFLFCLTLLQGTPSSTLNQDWSKKMMSSCHRKKDFLSQTENMLYVTGNQLTWCLAMVIWCYFVCLRII